jgi:hypothetical protein
MSRHEAYHQLKIVPCPCGSTEPYWHGPTDGRREYCCDACWEKMTTHKTLQQQATAERDEWKAKCESLHRVIGEGP